MCRRDTILKPVKIRVSLINEWLSMRVVSVRDVKCGISEILLALDDTELEAETNTNL